MSALFSKVAAPHRIEAYRAQKQRARSIGWALTVKNCSRQRGVPVFLFYLSRLGSDTSFHSNTVEGIAEQLTAWEALAR